VGHIAESALKENPYLTESNKSDRKIPDRFCWEMFNQNEIRNFTERVRSQKQREGGLKGGDSWRGEKEGVVVATANLGGGGGL